MFNIRIITDDFHTFHPYFKQLQQFKDRGITLWGSDAPKYDLTLVGQSIFQDKKLGSFEASLEKGMDALSKIDGPYILVDGQDSHSLIGAWETFIESDAICMLKHSLLKDRDLYKEEWVGGRYYWGKSEDYGVDGQNWKPKDFDKHKDRLHLSGTNWIGVPNVQWFDYSDTYKYFDVSAMFGWPHPECHEFDLKPSQDFYYNEHRRPVMEKIQRSPFMVAKLYDGNRVPQEVYSNYIALSKTILAPFGYGEMAPRDLESAQLGGILIKPDMDHVDTYPNIYDKDQTYLACKYDYSDLDEVIERAVLNFDELQNYFVNNMRVMYDSQYTNAYLADYTKRLLEVLDIL